ncbi:MAG TPA: GNAT family N-acetyltransferase [Chloroflexia bacterium]|jgi:arginase
MSMKKVQIITVPYDSGQRDLRMGKGPGHLLVHGMADRLRAEGHDVSVQYIEAESAFPLEVGTSYELYRSLANHVRAAYGAGRFPLVLAGNCGSVLGTIAGVGPERLGVVWFDAHGDFNTPDTTPSGFLDGMSLATATGRCWSALAATIPGFSPIPDANVIHIGMRDLDPAEKELLDNSAITALDAEQIKQTGVDQALEPALVAWRGRVDRVYLHLDLDVLDPEEATANQYAAPGGLTATQVVEAIELVSSHFPICAAAITAYDPTFDPNNLMPGAAIRFAQRFLQGSSIPGLAFRHFRGESDYPQIAEVFTRSWEADGKDVAITAEEAARLYSGMKNFDSYRDFLMVETSTVAASLGRQQLVAYGRAEWWDETYDDGSFPNRIYNFKFYVVPEWREKGLESAMLLHIEQHLQELASSHDFSGPRFFQSFVSDRYQAYTRALESTGYEAVRYEYEMVRPDLENVPDLPLPEGLEVRPVQPEHLRAIWEAEVEAFRDHWGFSEPEEEDYQHWLDSPHFQPHLWQVAWDVGGEQVAGMIRNYISEEENKRYGRQQGYTEWISVRRPWRRRGLARALLARSLQMHKELGMTQAALSVDSQNPAGALQLYESMGFRVLIRMPTYRKLLT